MNFFYFAKSTRRHCFRASHHYQACSSYLISWLGSRAREVNKCRIVNKITCLTLSIHPAKPWPYHSYRLETILVRIRREWPLFGFICKGWSIAPIVHDLRAIFQRPKVREKESMNRKALNFLFISYTKEKIIYVKCTLFLQFCFVFKGFFAFWDTL